MLKKEIRRIIDKSRKAGWVLEPDAKSLFKLAGLDVPRGEMARTLEEALKLAESIGYPVAAKVVSPSIIHKTDVGGVQVGIENSRELKEVYRRFSAMEGFAGMVVEEMLSGVELIIGAKVDSQFGPVVLLGIGGIGVEIYKDTAIRMAPLREQDVNSMIADIKARQILEGFRGGEPVDRSTLTKMMIDFSGLITDLEKDIESIDLNPVMCHGSRCVIADARIILSEN